MTPRLGRFLIITGALYIVSMLLWTVVRVAFLPLMTTAAQAVTGPLVAGGDVRFQRISPPLAEGDTRILCRNGQTGSVGMVVISSRESYMPLALFVSLVLATRLPWIRKLWSIVIGVAVLSLLLLFKYYVIVLHVFSIEPASLFELSSFWARVLNTFREIATRGVAIWFTVPVIVFLAVCIRKEDLKRVLKDSDGFDSEVN